MLSKFNFIILFFFCVKFVISTHNKIHGMYDDKIHYLPGLKMKPSFKHYAGHLNLNNSNFLFYWFVESQNSPLKDPLIFWFNGGPGCSSIDGLLHEMGPYVVKKDGKSLKFNPHAWNKFASVVYIESPVNVGYSYSTTSHVTLNDDETASNNYKAIKAFFTKFPQFKNHSTYIMGESYGGIYVPLLTALIIDEQNNFKINLKGIAIGNGYVQKNLNVNTLIRFVYYHGLIDDSIYTKFKLSCCNACADYCDFNNVSMECEEKINKIFEFVWSSGLNPYDLYRDCAISTKTKSIKLNSLTSKIMPFYENFLKKPQNSSFSDLKEDVPCFDDFDITTYMNNPKTRKALHIPSNLGNWSICSDVVTKNYQTTYSDMNPFIKKILNANVSVLLFYGDTDMACNFLLGQQFSETIALKKISLKKPWRYNHQIAGFKTMYEKNFTFLTVRGAGHMAAQWKAPQLHYVISKFLKNEEI